jgi:glyoxylase-like metal-dependent hydrolase (beta-lactamase superfamily II)
LRLTPEDITHLIITHGHFDQIGATDEFPNAQLFIQERELQRSIWAMALSRRMRWISEATDPGDILQVVDAARQGRLTMVKGAAENILPGIDLHPAYDSHTAGSQYIAINNGGRKLIIAGDLVYQYENLVGWTPNDPDVHSRRLLAGESGEWSGGHRGHDEPCRLRHAADHPRP